MFYFFHLVSIWLFKKFTFPTLVKNGESWCRNSPVTHLFFTFLTNHDTCVENEGVFSSWTYYGQTPLSILSISSLFGQKIILKQTAWALLNLCFLWSERDVSLTESETCLITPWNFEWTDLLCKSLGIWPSSLLWRKPFFKFANIVRHLVLIFSFWLCINLYLHWKKNPASVTTYAYVKTWLCP